MSLLGQRSVLIQEDLGPLVQSQNSQIRAKLGKEG